LQVRLLQALRKSVFDTGFITQLDPEEVVVLVLVLDVVVEPLDVTPVEEVVVPELLDDVAPTMVG
jgi:hypothetical protein